MPTLCKQYDGIPCDAAHPNHHVTHIKRLLRAHIFGALMDYFWEFMVFLKSLILCQKSANLKKLGNFEPQFFE